MLDDLSTQRYCSLFDLPTKGRFSFLEADVLSADLQKLFAGADVVVHLAAITNATASFENQQKVEEVNFAGTEKVARACLEADCSLIFPSTTSVYGTQAEVVDEFAQLHGGAGYMRSVPAERFYRDARLFRIYEGTSQIQQVIIARETLKRGG